MHNNHDLAVGWQGRLVRMLLTTYFAEERRDLLGELDPARVPKVVQPFASPWSTKVSFLATNVGFYAEFLKDAVGCLSANGTRDERPCIVTVTNLLPSWWWNWPVPGADHRFEYGPIAEYRDAQIGAFLRTQKAAVFRTVLICDDQDPAGLCKLVEWESEKEWLFLLAADGEPGRSDDHELCKTLLGYPNVVERVSLSADSRQYIVFEAKPDCTIFWDDHQKLRWRKTSCEKPHWELDLHAKFIRDIYAEKMHPADGGFTEVRKCKKVEFARFGSRPDITFVGDVSYSDAHCDPLPGNGSSVWEDKKWNPLLALLATMSPASETMFLAVVYDPVEVSKIWKETQAARNLLARNETLLGIARDGRWMGPR